ncbi:MAG: hypothetical protein JJE44_02160 [Flavobacteriaceae bacterium]|nr:hypothetical protein [Flavobacteriaceae bacterium]
MTTNISEIKEFTSIIIGAYKKEGIPLNLTIEDLKIIDAKIHDLNEEGFLDIKNPFSESFQEHVFMYGCYLGETLLKSIPNSKWVFEEDFTYFMNIKMEIGGFIVALPFQRTMKSIQNPKEYDLYSYAQYCKNKIIEINNEPKS